MKDKLEDLFAEYINECQCSLGLSTETIRGYRNSFRLLKQEVPTIKLETISRSTMIAFFSALQNRERKVGRGDIRKGVKISTVATHRSKLNSFFDWLVEIGKINENPFKKMKYPKVNYDDRRWMKSEEVEKVFTALSYNIDWQSNFVKKRNIAVFSVLLMTGLRKGELLGLKLLDIDFERNFLRVDALTSKSKKERVIPINAKLLLVLKDYLSERKKMKYSSPYLFVSSTSDGKLTDAGLKHLIQKVRKETGFNCHAHRFRHTFAVNMLRNGCHIAKLQQLMGHTDIKMTVKYLRRLPTDMMRADIELLTLDNLL